MRYSINYDELNECGHSDNLLLLHPTVIEQELLKIENKCPIYIIEKEGKTYNVLIPNQPIDCDKYTGEILYCIPDDVLIPVGGLDGKYLIKILGPCVEKKYGLTTINGYLIVDKTNQKVLFDGKNLRCLGKNFALIDNLFITKNTIIPHDGDSIIYDNKGYLVLNVMIDKNYLTNIYLLYNEDGNLVTTEYTYDDIKKFVKNTPVLLNQNFKKNVALFEQMIISSLKDREELQHCNADNLIDIVKYLQLKNIELAIDLDSLQVYKVNYKKYFNNVTIEKKEPSHILKLNRNKH